MCSRSIVFVLSIILLAHSKPIELQFSGNNKIFENLSFMTYDDLISESIMTSAVSYLSDNPRGEDSPISSHQVQPFTPTKLFEVFYKGKNASSVEFEKSLRTFRNSKYLNDTKVDRVQFRKNLYKTARAGSWELSRSIMAHLLLMVISDYADNTWYWQNYRYVPLNRTIGAKMAITIELSRLRNEIGETNFGQFLDLGVGTTLAFVIDDTGSMSGEINAAKRRVERITDHVRDSTDQPQEYVLVPFNDPFVGQVTNTRSDLQFKRALARLYAHGGGDVPEMAMKGIQLAIENCRPGSTIYVITDASAKDYRKQDGVIAQAIEKQITIVFLLTNDLSRNCRTSHGDESIGNFKVCYDLYQHIAEKTGGRVMVVGKEQFFKATQIIQSSLKQGLVVLKRQIINHKPKTEMLGEDSKNIEFYFDVDPSISEIVVEASGSCGNLNLTAVNGQISANLKRVGDAYIASKETKNHPSGKWVVMSSGLSEEEEENKKRACEIKAGGKSTTGFVMTTLVKNKHEEETKYRVLNGFPSYDHSIGFVMDFYGLKDLQNSSSSSKDSVSRVRFVNEEGHDVISALDIIDADNKLTVNGNQLEFYIEKGLPVNIQPFYIVVEGRFQGKHFSRVSNQLTYISHVNVKCSIEEVVFRSDSTNYFKVKVENNGKKEDNFTMSVSDVKGYASFNSSNDRQLRIHSGKSAHFYVKVKIPKNVAEGTASKVTISAKGWRPGSFQYHVCTIVLGQNKRPKVESFIIKGLISSRFAETVVQSTVTNNADVARDAEFEVMLPSQAFISNLTMEIGGHTVVGNVQEKIKAEKLFRKAKKLGKAAGHIAVRDDSTQVYKTNMLVPARTTITFRLTYQQLLKRIRGMYEYSIVIDPDQPVKSLLVDVEIMEKSTIKFVSVPGFKTEQTNRKFDNFEFDTTLEEKNQQGESEIPSTESATSITFKNQHKGCHVRYKPSLSTQTRHSPLGMKGVYTVQFDVKRTESSGKSVVAGGYFAHFFSAPFLPNPPKMLTFVIDVSGSMFGHKIDQVKQALKESIKSLNPEDYFNLVFFNNKPKAWLPSMMVPVKEIDINEALNYITTFQPEGGTNIGGAFDLAFDLITPYFNSNAENPNITEIDGVYLEEPKDEIQENITFAFDTIRKRRKANIRRFAENEDVSRHSKMIVFLTDGKPTVGKTSAKDILNKVKEMNQQRVAVHTIGFGTLVDMNFLNKLSGENNGISRRVFESLDAAVQIHNFIDEVVTPVMKNVTINFESDRVEELTSNQVKTIYEGMEVIVAGKFLPNAFEDTSRQLRSIRGQVQGRSMNDDVSIDFDIDANDNHRDQAQMEIDGSFTERLWSYLRIKELLNQANLADNETMKEDLKQQALNMSLSYNFVTPLTSLIALETDDKKLLEEMIENEKIEESVDSEKVVNLEKKIEETKEKIIEDAAYYDYSDELEEYSYSDSDEYVEYKDVSYATDFLSSKKTMSAPRTMMHETKFLSGSASRGGFYGDPHFVIPIKNDLNLCFNWNGRNTELYNLFYDQKNNVIVNGVFTTNRKQYTSESHKTFVSALMFIFKQQSIYLKINTKNAVFTTFAGVDYPLYFNSLSSFSLRGLTLTITKVLHSQVSMTVSTLNGLSFHVHIVFYVFIN